VWITHYVIFYAYVIANAVIWGGGDGSFDWGGFVLGLGGGFWGGIFTIG